MHHYILNVSMLTNGLRNYALQFILSAAVAVFTLSAALIHASTEELNHTQQETKFDMQLTDIIPKYPNKPQGNESYALIINGESNWDDLPQVVEKINRCAGLILVDGGANYFRELVQRATLQSLSINLEPLCLVGDLDSITPESLSSLRVQYPRMEIIEFQRNKDFTDLEAALQLVKIDAIREVCIFNALGGRMDQTLGNLLYLYRSQYVDKVHICTGNQQITVLSSESSKNAPSSWTSIPFYNDETGDQLFVDSESQSQELPNSGIYEGSFTWSDVITDLGVLLHCADHATEFQIATPSELIVTITPGYPFTLPTVIGQTISLIPISGPVHGINTRGLLWSLENSTLDKNFIGISNVANEEEITVSVVQGSLLCIINEFIDEEMLSLVTDPMEELD